MGSLLAWLAGGFAKQVGGEAGPIKTFSTIFPGYDFGTADGWLQLYVVLFHIAPGFPATTFVSKWATDASGAPSPSNG